MRYTITQHAWGFEVFDTHASTVYASFRTGEHYPTFSAVRSAAYSLVGTLNG